MYLHLPLTKEAVLALRAGDRVFLSGPVYTARDAAHKRLCALLETGEPLPIALEGATIYYMGPSPAQPGMPIGAAGPTTSGRMDAYAPMLLRQGLRGMIGKGNRSQEVIEEMKRCGAVYFAAVGGAGALLANAIVSATLVAYEDLGAEAIRKLELKDFPVIVAIDSLGNDLYRSGPEEYLASKTWL